MNNVETLEHNKAVVRRFLIDTHSGRFDVIDDTVAIDIVTHGMLGLDPDSRSSYRHFFEVLDATFKDMTFAIEAMVAEADQVAVRFTITAVHAGALLGIPATGRRVDFTGMVIYRLRDGMIAETWLYPDNLSLLQQLGALAA